MDIGELMAARKAEFDAYLEDYLSRSHTGSGLFEAMAYSLRAGGKRLRPILAMFAAEAVGGERSMALDAGLGIEMIHTFSLIHDDLPAIDDDDLRRGVPTCHRAYGEAAAILAGDALVFQAFSVICHAPYPDDVKADLCAEISRACGMEGLIEGEYEDIMAEGRDLPLENIVRIYAKKTARLFELSVYAGARAARADRKAARALCAYGTHLGMAFQAVDDILDVTSDAGTLGKASGKDARKGKATVVGVLGLEAARSWADRQTSKALSVLDGVDAPRAGVLADLALWLLKRVM